MPVPFPCVPLGVACSLAWPAAERGSPDPDPLPVVIAAPQTVERIDETLVVEWRTKRVDLQRKVAVFEGGIKATYGPTVLTADRLEVDMENKQGRADGDVRVVDPEGELRGSNLRFNWKERTGEAEDVFVQVGPMKLRVERILIEPDKWTLEQVAATPSRTRPPEFTLGSKKVVLRTGRSGRAENPTIDIFGKRILQIPTTLGFSLDRRVTGFRFPAISFRRGAGFGVAWNSSVLLNDQTSFAVTSNVFPTSLPTYAAEVAWSQVPPTRSTGLISPRTELGERFGDAYLDTIATEDPSVEDDYLRDPRRTLAIGSYWNQSTRGRVEDSSSVSKRYEISAEIGGSAGALGGFAQLRYQSIRPDERTPFSDRFVLTGSANLGNIPLLPGLDLRFRTDFAGFASGSQAFGWARGVAALVYRPTPRFRLAGGYVLGGQAGSPEFAFDRLYSERGWHVRADVDLGSIRAGFLGKYDSRQGRWYDHEYGFSFAAGSFEPYILWRQFPGDVRIGFRIRGTDVFKKLQRRTIERAPSPPAERATSTKTGR